jgi:ubiquinone/menaquinone biosynthesis C-methylase UbiE
MAAPATADAIRDVNTRYHDAAAAEYDHKWGIDFHEIGRRQVLGKLQKVLGSSPGPFPKALEIGAGTGYFSLNLIRAGVIGHASATDISPGMLATTQANAERLGIERQLDTVVTDAEQLPFADQSFDLVFGHAVLHHLPDLARAFEEFLRVLKPGGTLFFAGEPSHTGDRLANVPKQAALKAAPLWRKALKARPAPHDDSEPEDHALESVVDVHAFVPNDLQTHAADAGFTEVRVQGEELLANWFGWFNRTLEATADPKDIPRGWIQYAYRGYIALQRVDRAVLEPRLPPRIFYNLMLAARKPG